MGRMNLGSFIGDTYVKRVKFSKAVLWKSREISISPMITSQFKYKNTKYVVFEDVDKNERWRIAVDSMRSVATLKTEGQERQWYIPIEAFEVSKLQP